MKHRVHWREGKPKDVDNKTWRRIKYSNEKIFVSDSTYPQHSLRERILEDKLIQYICQICGIGPFWEGKTMPLVLDHVNGLNDDHRLENLRFVCSNCDSQLITYKSKNKRKVNRTSVPGPP